VGALIAYTHYFLYIHHDQKPLIVFAYACDKFSFYVYVNAAGRLYIGLVYDADLGYGIYRDAKRDIVKPQYYYPAVFRLLDGRQIKAFFQVDHRKHAAAQIHHPEIVIGRFGYAGYDQHLSYFAHMGDINGVFFRSELEYHQLYFVPALCLVVRFSYGSGLFHDASPLRSLHYRGDVENKGHAAVAQHRRAGDHIYVGHKFA
jgi:hypothetical protein